LTLERRHSTICTAKNLALTGANLEKCRASSKRSATSGFARLPAWGPARHHVASPNKTPSILVRGTYVVGFARQSAPLTASASTDRFQIPRVGGPGVVVGEEKPNAND
jgi:hypothetical protein